MRYALALGFLSSLILAFVACGPSDDDIQAQIDEANYCSDQSECTNVGSVCPFGCYVLVNSAEAVRMQKLLSDYKESCQFDCPALNDIVCEIGACKAITDIQ